MQVKYLLLIPTGNFAGCATTPDFVSLGNHLQQTLPRLRSRVSNLNDPAFYQRDLGR